MVYKKKFKKIKLLRSNITIKTILYNNKAQSNGTIQNNQSANFINC